MGVPGGRAECLSPAFEARRQWEPLNSPLWQATPRGAFPGFGSSGANADVLILSSRRSPSGADRRPATPLLGSDSSATFLRPRTPAGAAADTSRPRTAGSAAAGVEAARAAGEAAKAAADAALAAARLYLSDEPSAPNEFCEAGRNRQPSESSSDMAIRPGGQGSLALIGHADEPGERRRAVHNLGEALRDQSKFAPCSPQNIANAPDEHSTFEPSSPSGASCDNRARPAHPAGSPAAHPAGSGRAAEEARRRQPVEIARDQLQNFLGSLQSSKELDDLDKLMQKRHWVPSQPDSAAVEKKTPAAATSAVGEAWAETADGAAPEQLEGAEPSPAALELLTQLRPQSGQTLEAIGGMPGLDRSLPPNLAASVDSFLDGLSCARAAFDSCTSWEPKALQQPRHELAEGRARRSLSTESVLAPDGKRNNSSTTSERRAHSSRSVDDGSSNAMQPWQSPITGRTSLRRVGVGVDPAAQVAGAPQPCDPSTGAASQPEPAARGRSDAVQPEPPPPALDQEAEVCRAFSMQQRPLVPGAGNLVDPQDAWLQPSLRRGAKVMPPKAPPTMGNLAAMAAWEARQFAAAEAVDAPCGAFRPQQQQRHAGASAAAGGGGGAAALRQCGSESSSFGSEDGWRQGNRRRGASAPKVAEEPEDVLKLPFLPKVASVPSKKVSSMRDVYGKKEAFKLQMRDRGYPERQKPAGGGSGPGSARSLSEKPAKEGLKVASSGPGSARSISKDKTSSTGLLPQLPPSARSLQGKGALTAPVESLRRSNSAADCCTSTVPASRLDLPRRPGSDRGRREGLSGGGGLGSSRSAGCLPVR